MTAAETCHRRPDRSVLLLVAWAAIFVLASPVYARQEAAAGNEQAGKEQAAAPRPPGRQGSVRLNLGVDWMGSASLGTSTAGLTPNERDPQRMLTLFDAEARRQPAAGFAAGIGYRLTSTVALEGRLLYSRPDVSVSIRNDYERSGRIAFTGERMSQYEIGLAVVLHMPRYALSKGRVVPFVHLGGSYLRQLHEEDLVVDTGQVYFGGGGVEYFFSTRRRGLVTGMGLRGDVRLCYQREGYSLAESGKYYGAVGGALVLAF